MKRKIFSFSWNIFASSGKVKVQFLESFHCELLIRGKRFCPMYFCIQLQACKGASKSFTNFKVLENLLSRKKAV